MNFKSDTKWNGNGNEKDQNKLPSFTIVPWRTKNGVINENRVSQYNTAN